jgi:hypothetical protein
VSIVTLIAVPALLSLQTQLSTAVKTQVVLDESMKAKEKSLEAAVIAKETFHLVNSNMTEYKLEMARQVDALRAELQLAYKLQQGVEIGRKEGTVAAAKIAEAYQAGLDTTVVKSGDNQ